jgi:3-methyladenine DNA glycosylase/8-oxoguanine DNA glycosylase
MAIKFRFYKPRLFSLEKTVMSHGWVMLKPYSWNPNTLSGAYNLNGKGISFSIRETKLSILVEAECDRSSEAELRSALRYALNLDFPLEEFAKLATNMGRKDLSLMAREGWGRLLRSTSAWEDAAKTLLTTNCNWNRTREMTKKLCGLYCSNRTDSNPPFPLPKQITKNPEFLDEAGLGYRAPYLLELARRINEGEICFASLDRELAKDRNVAESSVRGIRGFGPYAVNHLLVLLGWHDCLAIDSDVVKYLGIKRKQNRRPFKDSSLYQEFGKFRFTAYKIERIINRENRIT